MEKLARKGSLVSVEEILDCVKPIVRNLDRTIPVDTLFRNGREQVQKRYDESGILLYTVELTPTASLEYYLLTRSFGFVMAKRTLKKSDQQGRLYSRSFFPLSFQQLKEAIPPNQLQRSLSNVLTEWIEKTERKIHKAKICQLTLQQLHTEKTVPDCPAEHSA